MCSHQNETGRHDTRMGIIRTATHSLCSFCDNFMMRAFYVNHHHQSTIGHKATQRICLVLPWRLSGKAPRVAYAILVFVNMQEYVSAVCVYVGLLVFVCHPNRKGTGRATANGEINQLQNSHWLVSEAAFPLPPQKEQRRKKTACALLSGFGKVINCHEIL